MNIVFLNPPNTERVQRRYMCSYNAPTMLLPPQELIALAGILREQQPACTAILIDAIAEELNTYTTIQKLIAINPQVIVAIQGFECFDEDMNVLQQIKAKLSASTMVLFGHYATLFPTEILEKTTVDVMLLGEPDNVFGAFMEAFIANSDISEVMGVAFKKEGKVIVNRGDGRIPHPEQLPMPAYELLQADKYFEPLLSAPFGLIQSARGCPYSCNFCVRSFGKRLTYRTTEQIIEEILFLKKTFGIKSLRFIDDTFTVHTRRVVEICQKMVELNMDIDWTCLSRIDTLREEMLPWMKKAGCKRIYFGVESGSTKVLRYFNKEIDMEQALSVLSKCSAYGIETVGFFIIGAPVEEETDFKESVDFAINAKFDYITVNEFTPYPGTVIFDALSSQVDFSLFPYKNEWKDASIHERNKQREKEFYRLFYFRRKYVLQNIIKAISQPREYINNVLKLANYIFVKRKQQRSDYI